MAKSPHYLSAVAWGAVLGEIHPLIDCQRCGLCCRIPSPIVANTYDIQRIARHLGVRPRKLQRAWDSNGNGRWFIPDRPCRFLTDIGCSVYEARPVACFNFPLKRHVREGKVEIAVSQLCEAGRPCIERLQKIVAVARKEDGS